MKNEDLIAEENRGLNESYKEQTSKASIYKSLAQFQQECPTIHKATKGYGYTYSDLPTIFKVINPILKKYSLGFTQLINDSAIETILFHTETGETIKSSTAIPQNVALKGMNDFQVLGSAVTYLRRYSLSSILGIVTDKDIDASGEQVPKKKTISDADFKRGFEKMELTAFKALMKDYDLTATQKETLNK
jgi:hypothetical protein